MRKRTSRKCYNVLVYNNSPAYELGTTELTQVEKMLCHSAVAAYYGADKRTKRPERSILLTGVNCGNQNENGEIDRDDGSMAAFILEQYDIPESDVLIGVETPGIDENLIACLDKHPDFTERVMNSNQTLGVVACRDQIKDIAQRSVWAMRCHERQVLKFTVDGPTREGEKAVSIPKAVVAIEPGVTEPAAA